MVSILVDRFGKPVAFREGVAAARKITVQVRCPSQSSSEVDRLFARSARLPFGSHLRDFIPSKIISA